MLRAVMPGRAVAGQPYPGVASLLRREFQRKFRPALRGQPGELALDEVPGRKQTVLIPRMGCRRSTRWPVPAHGCYKKQIATHARGKHEVVTTGNIE
jgi:hypothetical protein